MYFYEALQEQCRERGERLKREAGAEQLARQARGRRHRRRQRFAREAAFGLFRGARRGARLEAGT